MKRIRWSQAPLRLRLTLWYTLSLGLIFLLLSIFIYTQVRRSLIRQLDAALALAANQAMLIVDETAAPPYFQSDGNRLQDDFVIYLLDSDGEVIDILSNDNEIPRFNRIASGFSTQSNGGEAWRVYRRRLDSDMGPDFVQVAQELDPVSNALASLQFQLWTAFPLALLLAGLGGYFLASRALRPIDQMTQTAQAITAQDLTQRINYKGPNDELGRLARTFDTMLDRLQVAFVRERRFTGDAAHELRTPLAALKGRIGVTLSQPRAAAVYEETLREMEGQVDRLIRVSSDLLFMARLDLGKRRMQHEKIACADFIGAVVDQIRPLANEKSIALIERVPDDLMLYGDMDFLIRLVMNLLDNAIKYTPNNGRVAVYATPNGSAVQVSIEDSGPGIAPDKQPHLFERFYRVDQDRARQSQSNGQGGSGLGLAIAYEIARAHGGRIEVDSPVSQGAGTRFTVILPIGKDERHS